MLLACTSKTPQQRESVAPEPNRVQPSHPVRWSAMALGLNQLSQIDTELSKPFEDAVPVSRGPDHAVVTDCASCLELLSQRYEPSLSNDLQALRVMALRCLALKALRAAVPSARSYLTKFHLDSAALAHLPPDLALAVSNDQMKRRQEASDHRISWGQYQPEAAAQVQRDGALLIRGPGWEQRLQVVASGDFDADGVEDWLVQDEARMTQGTYRSVRLFELTRDESSDQLRVVRELSP